MANIRSSISTKSPYFISKYRFLELKNFCLQYPEWKRKINIINYYGAPGGEIKIFDISKPVERQAERRERYLRWMEMVEQSAIAADPDIYEWILKGVTEGVGYVGLNAPCGRDYYYERYRKFFWCLDKVRD